jgi:hypothetical protein
VCEEMANEGEKKTLHIGLINLHITTTRLLFFFPFQTGNSLEKSSDTSYMAKIINILSDEDKRIKSITFLVSFGLVKIIVWLYVDEQLKRRKSRRDEENEKEETKMNDPPTPQVPNPPCVVVISENQSSTSQ